MGLEFTVPSPKSFPADIYLFKANNVFIVKFEQISYTDLVFPWLTLNK